MSASLVAAVYRAVLVAAFSATVPVLPEVNTGALSLTLVTLTVTAWFVTLPAASTRFSVNA